MENCHNRAKIHHVHAHMRVLTMTNVVHVWHIIGIIMKVCLDTFFQKRLKLLMIEVLKHYVVTVG